jgi:copper transport protein
MGARSSSLTGGGMAGDSARLLVVLCAFVLASIAFFGATLVASAHASLLRSTPAEGAVVQAAPAEIALGFSETVAPLVVELLAPGGGSTRLNAKAAGADLVIAWPASPAAGTYLLSWRVVSSDGHPVAGVLTFSVGSPSAMPPKAPELNDKTLHFAIWSARPR